MALSNYERQKRWREKNRIVFNLRRRNARKSPAEATPEPSKNDTLSNLRNLMARASEAVEVPSTPTICRDNYGRVISQTQWNKLQAQKVHAKEHGFEYDDFSQ